MFLTPSKLSISCTNWASIIFGVPRRTVPCVGCFWLGFPAKVEPLRAWLRSMMSPYKSVLVRRPLVGPLPGGRMWYCWEGRVRPSASRSARAASAPSARIAAAFRLPGGAFVGESFPDASWPTLRSAPPTLGVRAAAWSSLDSQWSLSVDTLCAVL